MKAYANTATTTGTRGIMKRIFKYTFIVYTALFILSIPSSGHTQVIADYTAYPPFIPSGTDPNLLLMIDNSGSMYDLTYIDNGNAPTRESSYCYDQTYISTDASGDPNYYEGYFDKDQIYTYNFTDTRFEATAFPASCTHTISGELCVYISGSPSAISEFAARGNYLNWLATSKLDVQKQILTGGKYNSTTDEFESETRGCVGRRFIKEALTADYVEGGTNTSLGITFAVTGPIHEYNASAPSPGGQTSIQIFEGDYNESLCQTAIQTINDANNPAAIRKAVEDCLSYDPNAAAGSQYCLLDAAVTCSSDSDCDTVDVAGDCTNVNPKKNRVCQSPSDASMIGQSCVEDADCNTYTSVGPCVGGSSHSASVNTKIVFNQSIQECWQIWSGKKTEVGHDAWSGEAPKCAEVYSGYKICDGGTNDGNTCTTSAECVGGGTCIGGPDALRPGNPAIMCNSSYAGYCATTSDNWVTTTWVAKEYADEETCFRQKYGEFCGDVKVPQVIDPSDTPDDTPTTANVPAIIADIGIEAQLGVPIVSMDANRYDTTAPTGLINDYSDSIRFGVMKFNYNGSADECNISTTDSLTCPNICSLSGDACNTDIDCPSGETCGTTSTNIDAALVVHYIGEGTCSVTTSTACVRDDECPTDETCDQVIGDHDSGLIWKIDEIEANAWTPFAESYYNAVGYYVQGATSNPNLDVAKYTASADAIQSPLNSGDFVSTKNPIELSCQTNNILIISDGGATADLNSTMTSKVSSALFNDADVTDSSSCGAYLGSSYLDDLSYYSNNKNIFNPSDADPTDDDNAQRIKTFVVYTGTDASTETGECVPKTLMEDTALNGGTVLYDPEDPTELAAALNNAFGTIASGASSGSSVSLLSTRGEGSGAIYQAYFNPEPATDRKWFGYLHALFTDEYGNIREDTDGNQALSLTTDLIIEMDYVLDPATNTKKTLANRYNDSGGDGTKDSLDSTVTIDEINSLWRAGRKLWQTDPATRTIFTSRDGSTSLDFIDTNASALKNRLRAADDTEAENIINWTRGTDLPGVTDSGHASGYRERDITINGTSNIWKLGDIIYSTPTAVGAPKENYDLLYGDASYYTFEQAQAKRREVVYVGANDGMLHAFNAGCYDKDSKTYYPDVSAGVCTTGSHTLGQELWAYIPRGILPHLKWNTMIDYTHVYSVDLKPKVTDAKIFNGTWGTILIGGYRYGGKSIDWTEGATTQTTAPEYYALDITDPDNPRTLWTFTHPDLGLTMSYPSVAKINDEWFAIFGSGPTNYDSDSNLTAFQPGNLFVLKISDGTNGVIADADWVAGTNYWIKPTGTTTSFMSDSITVDRDIIDYSVDVVYVGENYDNGTSWTSRMLRFPTKNLAPGSWINHSTLLDIATVAGANDDSKKITAAPAAASDDRGNLWVFFGTGQFLGKDDKNLTDTGGMYAVKDACWDGSCTDSYTGLIDISSSRVNIDGSVSGISGSCDGSTISTWANLNSAINSCDGWTMYFKNLVGAESTDFTGQALQHVGERMFASPVVFGGVVSWAAYIPGTDECEALGESNAYAVYYKTGTAYKNYLFKEQKDQTTPDTTVARVKHLGVGMPSSPSTQVTEDGKAKLFFQQSTGAILTIENDTPFPLKSGIAGWKSEHIP